jgi:hypothetical protein
MLTNLPRFHNHPKPGGTAETKVKHRSAVGGSEYSVAKHMEIKSTTATEGVIIASQTMNAVVFI